MTTIAVLNPKGGSGKTTLSTHLARAFHRRGAKVLLVDSDPQGQRLRLACRPRGHTPSPYWPMAGPRI